MCKYLKRKNQNSVEKKSRNVCQKQFCFAVFLCIGILKNAFITSSHAFKVSNFLR